MTWTPFSVTRGPGTCRRAAPSTATISRSWGRRALRSSARASRDSCPHARPAWLARHTTCGLTAGGPLASPARSTPRLARAQGRSRARWGRPSASHPTCSPPPASSAPARLGGRRGRSGMMVRPATPAPPSEYARGRERTGPRYAVTRDTLHKCLTDAPAAAAAASGLTTSTAGRSATPVPRALAAEGAASYLPTRGTGGADPQGRSCIAALPPQTPIARKRTGRPWGGRPAASATWACCAPHAPRATPWKASTAPAAGMQGAGSGRAASHSRSPLWSSSPSYYSSPHSGAPSSPRKRTAQKMPSGAFWGRRGA
mmetsp:Transcript_53273/g.169211  ORF Transcript_53273/g.169211 Transcript_53273/m.169211 type:complete len:314 (-) Transcript_53273:2966-3907(-)